MAAVYRTIVLTAGFLQDSVAEYVSHLPVGAHVGILTEFIANENRGIPHVCLEPTCVEYNEVSKNEYCEA